MGEVEVSPCLIGQWVCSFHLEIVHHHQCNTTTALCDALNQNTGDHLSSVGKTRDVSS